MVIQLKMIINQPTGKRTMLGDPEGINRVRRSYTENELVHYSQRNPEISNFEGCEILIHLDSFCVGDTICFGSFLEAFLDHHKPKKVFVTTFFPNFFESNDPRIEFVPATSKANLSVDKHINVGYDKNNPLHTIGGLFYAARETMFIPNWSQPSSRYMIPTHKKRQPKKIVIAPESLKLIARWDYPKGWQTVVDHFLQRGYQIYNVSYEDYIKLDGVINYNGFDDINVSLGHILESCVFVGLSSGLAWLAWAYQIPVVMISGFTKEHNEFPCYRVSNKYGCNGCFNVIPQVVNECPIFIGTERQNECQRIFITPDMVIEKIEQAIKENPVIVA
jgi:autotransporter strand-loop-strand O-heptosyltransferase